MAVAHQEARLGVSRRSGLELSPPADVSTRGSRAAGDRPRRLLALDVDGTLVTARGDVAPVDKEAIDAARRRGVTVTICTGRLYAGTRDVALAIGLRGPLACMDGSVLCTTDGDREIERARIPDHAGDRIRELVARDRLKTFLFHGNDVVHDEHGEDLLDYVSIWSPLGRRVASVLDAAHWSDEGAPSAVVTLGAEDAIVAGSRALDGVPGVQHLAFPATRAGGVGYWGMVIRRAGVDKGTALAAIAAHHGVAMENVTAVGDWINDVPMLRVAGRSFAMAQAPDEVKRAATDVLAADAASGGGVAEAIARAGLA